VIYCVCVFPYMATLLSLYCPCCYAWFRKYTRLCLSRFPPSWHGWYESLFWYSRLFTHFKKLAFVRVTVVEYGWYESLFWYSRLFTHFKKLAFVRVTVVEYGWHASQFWYSRLFTHNMFVSNIKTKTKLSWLSQSDISHNKSLYICIYIYIYIWCNVHILQCNTFVYVCVWVGVLGKASAR